MPTPLLDHDQGFDTVAKPFHRQAFITALAVEALPSAVLPRLAGIDQGSRRHPGAGQSAAPCPQCFRLRQDQVQIGGAT